jgi:hypothetical protein
MEPTQNQPETAESLLNQIDAYAKDYGINHMLDLTQKLRELLKR